MINLHQPDLGQDELVAVAEVFADNWPGHGPRSAAFEAAFAEHLAVDPDLVVFLNSATAGLFLACELLDLAPGDEVVLPSISFVAAANAVVRAGARPVFCDVDPRTLNPTAQDIASVLTGRTRAVVVLHYGGAPGDIEAISVLCRERGVELVEDAACAVGSSVRGRLCGTFGDLGVWSFDAMKVMVTGDGGMLRAKTPDQARRARRLAYHGLDKSGAFAAARESARWWEVDPAEPGHRFLGNDLAAALGMVQLRRLPDFLRRRRAITELYDRLLSEVPGVAVPPALPDGHVSSHYFYWVQMAADIRDAVAAQLLSRGVYTNFRYSALHEVPLYGSSATLPSAERASRGTLLLPLHPRLDDLEVSTVADEFHKAVEQHTRESERVGR
ncbi:DegT/DnrJ/EryC1/StrS family aminotransferase [Actinokineospora globicatena]|uniref:Pyridoxal phosphate-dependent aminotransferase n=1 Tax=Actinokineospora globicatena TaxID=103729 RepID=A0A9W6V7D9_9PSEU|nr:DegT/DnrJ/EryC1/StrS family aminotransferase [Actinokineospora globicatena]GLW89884.1 pyridoxal phosphate-dependent aminotransferase [Actinokineospora globicatena]